MRMSSHTPPTLLELAQQRLLREETLPISALEYLPKELFPPVFVEALTRRRTDILRAMVQAWPFPCLPLGALLKTKDLEILQAVVDGADLLMSVKVRPRRWKLEVLDLRDEEQNFWNIWAGMKESSSSAQVVNENQLMKDLPRYASKRRLTVLADLSLGFHPCDYETKLLQWAQQRRGSLELFCSRLQMWALPMHAVRKVLTVFEPQYLQELEISTDWDFLSLVYFAVCYLGQMRNLRTLLLAQIQENAFNTVNTSRHSKKKCVMQFISQFSKLHALQHLYVYGTNFLSDHMKHLFRLLESPLETLSITLCRISQSDLNSLSRYLCLSQLKHLNLSGTELSSLCPVPLHVLLERVSDSLQTLQLEHCRMQDSQIRALLPALSQCSQLTKVNFCDNDISMAVLQDLLHHTASLTQLTVELYPAPLESYDDVGCIIPEMFVQHCRELMDTLRPLRHPEMVSFSTYVCSECYSRCVYDKEMELCHCWQ